MTACLDGSLPAAGLSKLRRYREWLQERPKPDSLSEQDWELKKHKLVFKMMDDLLDGQCPVEHLKDERLAKIVCDAFVHFSEERYSLMAYVVMPSHHHWMFLPKPNWVADFIKAQRSKKNDRTPREAISHSIQSYTGTQCNRMLAQKGSFWQTETFDHFARDEAEASRIIHYIEQNPVKAGLVQNAVDWPFSSAPVRKRLSIEPGFPIPKLMG
ncbi:hypothetical protein [Stieleria mannarensis]|uniref:hypothetical protein n=1 Tax=Stieleria mannarensis TaxID=2755585 RepID=UPI00336A5890